MSITGELRDELRKYARAFNNIWLDSTDQTISFTTSDMPPTFDSIRMDTRFLAIADRIDEKHKRAIGYVDDRDPETMAENGWIRLPKDIDDEYIHIGDEIDCGESTFKVNELRLTKTGWNVGDCRHHKPTVEDVLAEMLDAWGELPSNATNEAIIAEYAKKLQLRKEDA